jgi:hypothetical protein
MSSSIDHTRPRGYDAIRFRRGTRGFAAVVTALNGFVVLAVGAVVLPSTRLSELGFGWAIPLVVVAGLLHLVAVVGLVRGRTWSRSLVGYLSAAGIGVAAYSLLALITGLDLFAATSALPAEQAGREGLGVAAWMIGAWLVAARFAIEAFASSARPAAVPVTAATRVAAVASTASRRTATRFASPVAAA